MRIRRSPKKASAPPGTIPARAVSTGRALTWLTISCWWERTTAETATPARPPGCCFWTPRRGELLDSWDGLNADIRSTVVYDAGRTPTISPPRAGTFYSVQVTGDRKLTNKWSVNLANGVGGVPMSTSTPVVYGGRAYIGVSGAGQFTPYSGHNITVIDVVARRIAYRVETQGYPQTSGLLTTAYEQESGCVYVYFFDNMTPGKLRVLRDRAGQTTPDYVTTEGGRTTALCAVHPHRRSGAVCHLQPHRRRIRHGLLQERLGAADGLRKRH